MTITVVTVAVGDYIFGAAALINSLARANFSGKIIVYADRDPQWRVASSCPIDCRTLEGNTLPFNLKARAIAQGGGGDVVYIDADCIIPGRKFFDIITDFLDHGPVFSTEGILPRSDIRHVAWRRQLKLTRQSERHKQDLDCCAYINSGLVAVRLPRDNQIISAWQQVMDQALGGGGQFFEIPYYQLPDQDCLNAVIANLDVSITTVGPPDIWYRSPPSHPFAFVGACREPILLHCTGSIKPWHLKQPPLERPDAYDRLFYHFTHEDKPWIDLSSPSPAGVSAWMRDTKWIRIKNRMRRSAGRALQLMTTLLRNG